MRTVSHGKLAAAAAALAVCLPLAPDGLLAQDRAPTHGSALVATPAIAELLSPFRGRLEPDDVAEVLERRRRWTGFPRTAEDHVLAARLWRRAGLPDRALAELDRLLPSETGALDRLERARILLETDEDRSQGARLWWAACEGGAATMAEIHHDILPLTTPAERDEWAALVPGPSVCDWLRRFWDERASRMVTTADERLALHYRRLAHAREWYWIPKPYFYRATADYHGRPDGLAIDDRGLMYVRMGHPLREELLVTTDAGESVNPLETGFEALGDPFLAGGDDGFASWELRSCWPYWRPGGYRIYCFSDGRLIEGVPGSPGTQFFHTYLLNSNLPASAVRHRVVRRPGGGLREPWEAALDMVEARAWGHHIRVRTRENIDDALIRIPDVPAIRPRVTLRVETLRFLNPSEGRWLVWTLASVRAGDLQASPDERLNVGGRYSLLRPDGVELRVFPDLEVAGESLGENDAITLRSVFAAQPGPLPLTLVVEDRNEAGAGNWFQDTVDVPAVRGLPQLSDVAVAQSAGGSWTRDGRTFLNISPDHVTAPDGSIHTYFEVYNVRSGRRYDVEVRLAPEGIGRRIWSLEADDLAFRLQFAAEMRGEIGRHHLRLDLEGTEPGEYVLAVRIRDEVTTAYSLPSVTHVHVVEN